MANSSGPFRVGQVAKMLGVQPATVRKWCREDKLDAIETAGGHYRIPAPAIDALVEKLTGRKHAA